MTPRHSIVGRIAESRWWADPWRRRPLLLVLALVLTLLSFFPRQYRAAATLAPQNASTTGISAVAGATGAAYSSFLANYLPVEVDLTVTRSVSVREAVYRRLDLANRQGYGDHAAGLRRLEREMSIRSLRASIIEISTKDPDEAFALALVRAFADEGQAQIAKLSREQTAYKRSILANRLADATARLNSARADFNDFRRRNRMTDPGEQLGDTTSRLTVLQAGIKGKEAELATARRFQTDESMKVKTIQAELAVLRQQLTETQALSQPSNSLTVAGAVQKTTEYDRLLRRLTFAQGLHDAYARSLEGTALEELTADFNMAYLEKPYIDPDRVFNIVPLIALILLISIGGATEFYMLRPPVGAYRMRTEP